MTRRKFLKAVASVSMLAFLIRLPDRKVEGQTEDNIYVGGVMPDWLAQALWGVGPAEHLRTLHQNGFRWIQQRLTTVSSLPLRDTPVVNWSSLPWQDEYWCCLEYTTETFKRAADLGMKLNLLLYLSREAAWPCRQNIPPEWRKLDDQELSLAVQTYCSDVVKHLQDNGIRVDLYNIGNEIELGILNTTDEANNPGECVPPEVWRTAHPYYNVEYVQREVWPREARLLKAAIQGIKRNDPDAKVVLHADSLGRSPNGLLARSFFETMVVAGVPFDYASLTYADITAKPFFAAPARSASPYYKTQEFRSIVSFLASLGKRVIIGEYLYPHAPAGIEGDPDPGYPYTPDGQAKWIRDFLSAMVANENIAGLFYFDPEYFPGETGGRFPVFESSGLFRTANES